MRALGALAAAAVLLAAGGCGGGGQATTGAASGSSNGGGSAGRGSTAPAPSPTGGLEETSRPADPGAVRVIRGWTDAQRSSDVDRATSYFAVPAIVENGTEPLELSSRRAIHQFNAGLP